MTIKIDLDTQTYMIIFFYKNKIIECCIKKNENIVRGKKKKKFNLITYKLFLCSS